MKGTEDNRKTMKNPSEILKNLIFADIRHHNLPLCDLGIALLSYISLFEIEILNLSQRSTETKVLNLSYTGPDLCL